MPKNLSKQFDNNTINNYFPLKSNNANPSTSSIFEARAFYSQKTVPFVESQVINGGQINFSKISLGDLRKKNLLHGIVDFNLDIVIPTSKSSMKEVPTTGKPLFLQDFVADAATDMINYMNTALFKNKLSNNSVYANIKVYKAYEDLNTIYYLNAVKLGDAFRTYSLTKRNMNSLIIDEKTFNKYFISFLKDLMHLTPITKSYSCLYYNYSIFSGGLCFSISNENASDDKIKYLDYFMDNDYKCFVDATKRFGFKIDKNVPWILFADIKSPALKKYLQKYYLNTAEEIFDKRYTKVYTEDVDSLSFFFYLAYATFMEGNNFYETNYENICNGNIDTSNFRNLITPQEYYKTFKYDYWVRLYSYFRHLETNSKLTQQDFDYHTGQAVKYFRYNKKIEGSKIINDMYKKHIVDFYKESMDQKDNEHSRGTVLDDQTSSSIIRDQESLEEINKKEEESSWQSIQNSVEEEPTLSNTIIF